jgi:hypothetical protein
MIGRMLNIFPQSPNTDRDMFIQDMEICLEGISNEAIIATCKQYMQGKVEGHNKSFAPSGAEFALNARKHHYDNLPERPMIAAPVEREVNPAYRMAMIKKLELFSCALKTGRTKQFERWSRRHPITIPMYEDELVK